jgi:hypothetical protein
MVTGQLANTPVARANAANALMLLVNIAGKMFAL